MWVIESFSGRILRNWATSNSSCAVVLVGDDHIQLRIDRFNAFNCDFDDLTRRDFAILARLSRVRRRRRGDL